MIGAGPERRAPRWDVERRTEPRGGADGGFTGAGGRECSRKGMASRGRRKRPTGLVNVLEPQRGWGRPEKLCRFLLITRESDCTPPPSSPA